MQTRAINPDTRCAPFGACAAPPGAVVFHRYLQQLNNEHRIHAAHHPQPADRGPCPPLRRSIQDSAEFTSVCPAAAISAPTGVDKGPKIGDVSPVEAPPLVRAVTQIVLLRSTPITGRLIDILA